MTPAELLDLANRIGKLGDEMGWVGDELLSRAARTEWTCAKADRYRAALAVRRTEAHRIANEIYFLAYWAKMQAKIGDQTGKPNLPPHPVAGR
jgi:hypothetical protein